MPHILHVFVGEEHIFFGGHFVFLHRLASNSTLYECARQSMPLLLSRPMLELLEGGTSVEQFLGNGQEVNRPPLI